MKKIISFIVLVACGIVIFLYLGKDTVSTTSKIKNQKKQPLNKVLLPDQKSVSNQQIDTPESPTSRSQLQPSPDTAGRRRVNPEKPKPESDPIEEDSTNSYPIEDADIHFVPPEQRYPGNLGGPPPLDLPYQE